MGLQNLRICESQLRGIFWVGFCVFVWYDEQEEYSFVSGRVRQKARKRMDSRYFSHPLDLKNVEVTDEFWGREQELVRTQVIPYQWEALNDRVEGAAPSYCMHNFRAAGRLMKEKRDKGAAFVPPAYTDRGFEVLPEDPQHPEPDRFYGFVFQDTDFSKWIEAVGYSLIQKPDPELERTADEAIDVVCAAQADNGYLDTYYIINGMDRAFTNLKDHHELYCLGHLVEGAVSYYQATGKDKLLRAACRFADYVSECFGAEEGKRKGYPGHEIAEMALVRLYEATGDKKYLDLGKFFLDQRGTQPYYFEEEEKERAAFEKRAFRPGKDPLRYAYYQAHQPVREQSEAVGHAVRAGYLYSGMADVARLTQDEGLFAACERLWKSVVREKLYITGGVGGTNMGEAYSYPFDLPNDTAYSETCAAIALVFWARRMLQARPHSAYGDVMEQALYNTVLSGMSLDGKSFFYVNPLEVVPEACRKDARKEHVKPVRQKWFGCACCPPNIARIVSSAAAYAYTESEEVLWTHLYMGSTVSKRFGGKRLDLKVEARMPLDGAVTVQLHAPEAVRATLAFRLPGWSKRGEIALLLDGKASRLEWSDGASYAVSAEEKLEGGFCILSEMGELPEWEIRDGYLYLTRNWQDGDSFTLSFRMDVRMQAADGRVREDIGKVAFTRGPLTFCMEEADNGKNLHLYRADLERIGEKCEGIFVDLMEELGHPMAVLKVPALKQEIPEGDQLYHDYRRAEEKPATLTFIPYYAWSNRGEGEMSVWLRV